MRSSPVEGNLKHTMRLGSTVTSFSVGLSVPLLVLPYLGVQAWRLSFCISTILRNPSIVTDGKMIELLIGMSSNLIYDLNISYETYAFHLSSSLRLVAIPATLFAARWFAMKRPMSMPAQLRWLVAVVTVAVSALTPPFFEWEPWFMADLTMLFVLGLTSIKTRRAP